VVGGGNQWEEAGGRRWEVKEGGGKWWKVEGEK